MFNSRSGILRALPSPRRAKAVSVFLKTRARALNALLCTTGMALLVGCGQPGPLYLPTDPAAVKRATLPETLNPLRKPPNVTPTTTPATTPSNTPADKAK